MTRSNCATKPDELLEYWLGELDEARELRMDEHLFACAACSERLSAIVNMGAAIRRVFVDGWLNIVLPVPFIARVKAAGLHVREYTLTPGGSVDCTVTPDDDLVVSYLHAPLGDARRVDLVLDDSTSGKQRVNDVAFDPSAERLVMVTSTAYLRTLKRSQLRARLVAVEGVQERVIGEYTFNHYPS
jgi:hypothetical protein